MTPFRIHVVLLIGLLVAGCAGQTASPSAGGATASPSQPSTGPGSAIAAGQKPSAQACRKVIVADTGAAGRIRADLKIATTKAAIKAAAADPKADVALVGIPLTRAEVTALRATGVAFDPSSALSWWIHAGEPKQFGGIWIDPPGSDRYVVSIVGSDPATLTLARCLDTGVDVRFVAAGHSMTDLEALRDRITTDAESLRSGGVMISSVGLSVRAQVMVVIVGVTGVTPAIKADLASRYGDAIVVEEQGPLTPA